jgi:protein TonB
VYPAIAKRLGEQGTVKLKALVDETGKPTRIQIIGTSGSARLDQAAVDYFVCSRFFPGRVNGVPTAMWYEAPINFILE